MKVINQIVSGMGFLHSRNVVHRDLKPANVLISETDDVNICDFGLSRLIEPDATTMTAEVGTPSYMAPEMATMGGINALPRVTCTPSVFCCTRPGPVASPTATKA